jgi:hypothetical protein
MVFAALLLLVGCSFQPYHGGTVAEASFLQRSITQELGPLRVTAAVPDAEETKALIGLDLYEQGIQPVWLKVDNLGSVRARITFWSIDRDYFSPIEVAYKNRKQFSSEGYQAMERWFHENGLERRVPAGESRSGLVFTNYKSGTKGFILDIFSSMVSYNFTFFVPIPGFTPDYSQVDFATLYAEEQIVQLDQAGLKTLLEEELSCCAGGPDYTDNGAPLNVAFVGTPAALARSLLRGGWDESEAESEDTERARQHLFHGRPPDAIFHKGRKDGDERMGLLVWRAPWNVGGEPGWVGSAYYTLFEKNLLSQLNAGASIRDSTFLRRFVKESVSADLDSAKRFLLQNFWYNQSLAKAGIVKGVGESGADNPIVTFDGVGYFTDGTRFVMFLSETPVALDDTEYIYGLKIISAGAGK